MAAIIIRQNAKATWLTAMAGVCAKACAIVQRAMACAAATIMICAVGAASPAGGRDPQLSCSIAVTAMTLMAAALLQSLRRHLRAHARQRPGPGTRTACSDKPARI